MILRFISFIIFVIAALVPLNFLVYWTVITFLPFNHPVKYFLLVLFIFFILSFFVASFLAHFIDDLLVRVYYFLASLWLGLVGQLILVSAFIWLLYFIGKEFNFNLPYTTITIVLFSATFIWTAYGVWQAFHPQVKSIQVALNNLPADWQGKTIVQLSDLHLGPINGGKFMDQVAEMTNRLNPEIIVITGDLFDGLNGKAKALLAGLKKLQAKQGIYFVTGNHETYVGSHRYLPLLEQTDIKFLDNEIVNLNGLQLIGLSYPNLGQINQIEKIIRSGDNYNKKQASILLYHIPVSINISSGASQRQAYLHPRTDFSYVKNLGIDLQLSGHTHAGQIFPFNIITRWIFNGYHYGLHKDGDFNIFISSGTGTWGPPIRTAGKSEIVAIELN